ncbi:hypothetical protein [Polaribacter septentrionalilitoris]|uniref:hypothetical protein n=1 Tax=Polaribacter septentrionalilitoris TaxID=2494657 RepID=UPI00135A04DE|nr:hypothetical protein [Polaribacter septentrionalilitoris]
MEYFFIGILAFCLSYIVFNHTKILYYRKLKSFNKEIEEFLKSNKQEFIEKRRPNKEDWKKSSIKKPANFEVSFFTLQINGSPVTWTDTKHRIIIAKNQNHKKYYWLEIKTTYFKKPELKFTNLKIKK